MSNLLLIWGAGGHGKVVLDVARSTKQFEHIAFLDDDPARSGLAFCECSLFGGFEQLDHLAWSAFVVAVGDNHIRARCFSRALDNGLVAATLIHSTAIISPSAHIGRGTVVMPGAIVNAGAMIGENCIINSGVVIEHDCEIDSHVHISPRAVLGGGVKVGLFAHVGLGAVLLPRAVIGEESVVGAGAVVLKEVQSRCIVAGVPAKALSYA